MKFVTGLALAFGLLGTLHTSAFIPPPPPNLVVLNFDDLGTSDAAIPGGYGGIDTWLNFRSQSTTIDNALNAPSQPNFAYDGDGTVASLTNSTPFFLYSFDLGSLTNDTFSGNMLPNSLTVTGFDAGNVQVFSETFSNLGVNDAAGYIVNSPAVSTLVFTPSNGGFTMDDVGVAVTSAPEPSTYALMGLTLLAAAGFGAFRKFSRQS